MRRGFSLVELLVVITVLGIFAGVAIPAIQTVRESSRRVNCLNKMRQLALAVHQFEAAHGHLPETLDYPGLHHWHFHCLPYLEQVSLHERIKLEGLHPFHTEHLSLTISELQCLSNPDNGFVISSERLGAPFAYTDYCGVAGSDEINDDGLFRLGIFPLTPLGFKDCTGGLSQTLMIGERPPAPFNQGIGAWLGSQSTISATMKVTFNFTGDWDGYPTNCGPVRFGPGVRFEDCDVFHHWSYHPGGGNFAKADGSVSFIEYGIDTETLRSLASRE